MQNMYYEHAALPFIYKMNVILNPYRYEAAVVLNAYIGDIGKRCGNQTNLKEVHNLL